MREGDRVKLNPDSEFYSSVDRPNNPWNVEGTIKTIFSHGSELLPVIVEWDNEHSNSYHKRDLIFLDEIGPREAII